MRTRALIGTAMLAIVATVAGAQEPKPKTGADHPMLTIEGCTTGAKDVPTVPDSATEPWIEVASYRDLKERCDK